MASASSTGLFYVPRNCTPTEEVIELANGAGKFGGMHISRMRDEAAGVVVSGAASGRSLTLLGDESSSKLYGMTVDVYGGARFWRNILEIAAGLLAGLAVLLHRMNRWRKLKASQKQWPTTSARVVEPAGAQMFGSGTARGKNRGITVVYSVNGKSYEAWLNVKHKPRADESVVVAYNPRVPRQAILRT